MIYNIKIGNYYYYDSPKGFLTKAIFKIINVENNHVAFDQVVVIEGKNPKWKNSYFDFLYNDLFEIKLSEKDVEMMRLLYEK